MPHSFMIPVCKILLTNILIFSWKVASLSHQLLYNILAECGVLASYPGSRIKGVGGKESLVYTVCACSRFSQNSGKIVFVRVDKLGRIHRMLHQKFSLCLLCNQFLRMKSTHLKLKEEQKQSIQKLLKIYKC